MVEKTVRRAARAWYFSLWSQLPALADEKPEWRIWEMVPT